MTISWPSHHAINGIMVRIHQSLNQARWDDLAELFDGARLEVFIGGRYEDEFRRVDGTWRLVQRTCHADFTGDRSHHLAVDPYDTRLIDRE